MVFWTGMTPDYRCWCWWCRKTFICYLQHLSCLGLQGAFPRELSRYTLDGLTNHYYAQAYTHLHAVSDLEMPNNLLFMSLGCGRKPEYPKAHTHIPFFHLGNSGASSELLSNFKPVHRFETPKAPGLRQRNRVPWRHQHLLRHNKEPRTSGIGVVIMTNQRFVTTIFWKKWTHSAMGSSNTSSNDVFFSQSRLTKPGDLLATSSPLVFFLSWLFFCH